MKSSGRSDSLVPAALLALSLVPVVPGIHRLAGLAGRADITPENARFFAAPLPVVLHIITVIPYCILGAFQFAPGFRRRRPRPSSRESESRMNRFRFLWMGVAASLLLLATPTSIRAQNRPELLEPTYTKGQNLPFSEGVRVGDVLYLSGIVGIKPGTMTLVPGGLEAEVRQVFDNLEAVLKGAGAAPSDVVKCTVMLNDIRQWSKFNEFYAAFFKQHRPARSALGVAGLALGAAVELECMAVSPRKSR